MGKNSVKFFGIGDGWPCDDRNHSSFLYHLGKNNILLDCGEPISGSYKKSGLSYDAIDQIIISHLHSDHIGGFFMLMQGLWLEQRKKDLPIAMPAGGIKLFKRLLNAAFIFDELLPFKIKYEPLKIGQAIITGNARVTPYRSSHLEQLRRAFQKKYPQEFKAFCFLIEAGGVRIGHSADIGRPEDLEPLLKKPLDLLVCELAHFNAEDLFLYLRDRAIKRIIFMHVARPYWENLKRTQRLAARMLPGIPCIFAKDGQEFVI